jgi:Major Facilitator Superfamily
MIFLGLVAARQFCHGAFLAQRCQRHLRLELCRMLLPDLRHPVTPSPAAILRAGISLSHLSSFRGPAHNWTLMLRRWEISFRWFADKVGARISLLIAIFWWSIFTAPTAAAHNVAAFLGCRLLLGIGETGVYPSCAKVTAVWCPRSERGSPAVSSTVVRALDPRSQFPSFLG